MKATQLTSVLMLVLSIMVSTTYADETTDLVTLKQSWAIANFDNTNTKNNNKAKEKALENLIGSAAALVDKYPNSAEALIWEGIVRASYAGAAGGLSALGEVKKAKALFEAAMEIDPEAMSGSAYTSLGSLYYQVPGWPIAFGSDKKAEQMLKKGLALNPNGVDSNFFYAEFMKSKKAYESALKHYIKVMEAAPRSDQPTADKGRRSAAQENIDQLQKKLGLDKHLAHSSGS